MYSNAPQEDKTVFFGMLRPENRHFAGGTGGRRSRPPREHGGVHLGGPGVEYRLVWSSTRGSTPHWSPCRGAGVFEIIKNCLFIGYNHHDLAIFCLNKSLPLR